MSGEFLRRTDWKKWTVANRKWLLPLALALLVKLFSLNSTWVEKAYSTGLYPLISRVQRFLLGWLPFSLGDLFYGFLVLYILYKTGRFFRRLFKKQFTKAYLKAQLSTFAVFALWLYVGFQMLWGLNYSRKGIAWQLQLDVKAYSNDDLAAVLSLVKAQVNANVDTTGNMSELSNKKLQFRMAMEAYTAVEKEYPFLAVSGRSVKPTLYGYIGNYLGFLGYYNPFSGEAQVNTTVPVYVQPNITCHEMAHQLGYAKENEANFVGYLAAKSAADRRFRYSAYFDLLQYAALELQVRDSALARRTLLGLHPQVRKDLAEWREFRLRHRNPIESVVMWFYGQYLKANSMPNGVSTYNEVVAWLVAYYKKYGAGKI
jgi:hypothetical protein